MAYNVQRLTQRIQTFEPKVLSAFSEDFASNRPDHRNKIRAAIADALGTLEESERAKLLNLDEVPRLKNWSVSISHCAALGGWLAAPLPLKVGLDIEVKRRIHDKLIKRIAAPEELKSIPDPAFLWCAKESYYKALASDQPAVITQLVIGGWKKKEPDFYNFSSKAMKGSLFSIVDLLVSVSII